MSVRPNSSIFLLVFAPFALAYFLSYLLRNANAVLSQDLIATFDLSKGDLGLMTGAYFLSFTLAQIPLGFAMDRYGPRKVQSLMYCFAALGCLCFATATGFTMLTLGRFLIGLGVAGGLMCGLKALSLWFPSNRLPLINNLMLAIGGLGSMAATAPLQWVNVASDWRTIFLGLVMVALIVPALLILVTPEAQPKKMANKAAPKVGMLEILQYPLFWALVPAMCFGMAAGMTIQSLWVGPWIDDQLAASPATKGVLLLAINSTFVITALGIGWASTALQRLGFSIEALMISGLVIGVVAFVALALLPPTTAIWFFAPMIFAQNATFLIYAYMTQKLGAEVAGRSNSLINVTVFGGVWLMITAFGQLLDGVLAAGGTLAQGYSLGFGILALGCGLSALWAVWGLKRQSKASTSN